MKTGLRKMLVAASAVVLVAVGVGVYHDTSVKEANRELQEKIWAHEGALVDACDAAYGQGRRVTPASLSDEASFKHQRSNPAYLLGSGESTVVVLVPNKKVCRVHNTTYEVLEKL